MSDPTPPPGTGRDWRTTDDVLADLREALGDTWAGPNPVSADEARAVLDAVAAVLGVTPPNTDPLFPTTWTPAKPGDTPGQVEPDDAQPQPINACRDLRAEIVAACKSMLSTAATRRGVTSWEELADAIVDALHLDDLTAELASPRPSWLRQMTIDFAVELRKRGVGTDILEGLDAPADAALAEIDRLTAELGRLQADRDEANAENERLRAGAELIEAKRSARANAESLARTGLALNRAERLSRFACEERDEALKLARTGAEEAARVTADRDRLRAEVTRIADEIDTTGRKGLEIGEPIGIVMNRWAANLRALLDATTATGPATAPVLAVDTTVLLADGPALWRVSTWDVQDDEDGTTAIVLLRPRDATESPLPADGAQAKVHTGTDTQEGPLTDALAQLANELDYEAASMRMLRDWTLDKAADAKAEAASRLRMLIAKAGA